MKRNTKQRALILQMLDNAEHHPTASWLFAEARKVMPRISLGTVYRLLDALVDEGQVCRLILADGSSRYEHQQHLHPHVVCRACGRVADAPPIDLNQVLAQIGQLTGYQLSSFQFSGYGLCPTCHDTAQAVCLQAADGGDAVSDTAIAFSTVPKE